MNSSFEVIANNLFNECVNLKVELAKLRAANAALQAEVDRLRPRNTELSQELDAARAEAEQLRDACLDQAVELANLKGVPFGP